MIISPYTEPRLLTRSHDTEHFDSGEPILDNWLFTRAMKNSELGASKTYVTCSYGTNSVIGFYSLAAGQIERPNLTGSLRRNMPDDIPGIHLGRFAVDSAHQGKGVARALLLDAIERSNFVSTQIAARIVFVHALNENAARFYEYFGFKRLPVETNTLALDLLDF